VSVINGSTNTVTSTISAGSFPYAVAVNPSTNTVYVANSSDNSVSVINGSTNTVTSTISAGNFPYAVAVNPSTNTVYVTNPAGNSVSVINGSTNTVTATVSVGSNPFGMAVNPSTNTIYVANSSDNSVSVINGATLPQAPNITSSSSGNGSVSLAWTAASDGDGQITSYSVAAAPPSGPAISTSVPASQLSAAITGLTNGTTYSVTVTAISSLGAGSASNPVSVKPTAVLPGTPIVTSSSAGNGSASLAWTAPSAGDASILFYKLVTTSASSSVTTLYDASTTSVTLNGLTNGTVYSLTVTAVSGLGAGQASNPVSLTPRKVPTAPKSPKATAGTRKVTLSWSLPSSNGGSAITGYWIYVGTSAGHESATPINASQVKSLTYRASSLTKGKKYFFVIRAVNVAGTSPASVEVSATAK
jgi:YVTN family beta-propeller protein